MGGCAAGPWTHKTLSNRFVRWSRLGVFARNFRDLARPGTDGDPIMIDSTHLKAHRTAASLSKGGDPASDRPRSWDGLSSKLHRSATDATGPPHTSSRIERTRPGMREAPDPDPGERVRRGLQDMHHAGPGRPGRPAGAKEVLHRAVRTRMSAPRLDRAAAIAGRVRRRPGPHRHPRSPPEPAFPPSGPPPGPARRRERLGGQHAWPDR